MDQWTNRRTDGSQSTKELLDRLEVALESAEKYPQAYVLCTGGVNLGTLQIPGLVCLLVVGLFHTGVTYCLYFSALKDLPGQKAAILSYIDPLVAVLISVVVLGESMGLLQVVGGLLILGFTLWNELSGTKE